MLSKEELAHHLGDEDSFQRKETVFIRPEDEGGFDHSESTVFLSRQSAKVNMPGCRIEEDEPYDY